MRHRYGYDPARFGASGRRDGDRPFTVGFVGRGEPRKGLHIALERLAATPAPAAVGRFVIAGAIDPDYREVLAPLLAHRASSTTATSPTRPR